MDDTHDELEQTVKGIVERNARLKMVGSKVCCGECGQPLKTIKEIGSGTIIYTMIYNKEMDTEDYQKGGPEIGDDYIPDTLECPNCETDLDIRVEQASQIVRYNGVDDEADDPSVNR